MEDEWVVAERQQVIENAEKSPELWIYEAELARIGGWFDCRKHSTEGLLYVPMLDGRYQITNRRGCTSASVRKWNEMGFVCMREDSLSVEFVVEK